MGRRSWIAAAGAAFLSACALFTDLSGLQGTDPPDDKEAGREDGTTPTEAGGYDGGATLTDAGDAADVSTIDACGDADITDDPEHCGACNHSCLGGSCTFGKCSPVPIITGLNAMAGLTIAGDKIYVGIPGGIRRYELDGTQGIDVVSTPNAVYLTANATHLYFVENNESKVKRWPLAGGIVEDVVLNANATGIALSATHVYFTHYETDGGVERVPIGGGARETVFAQYGYPEDVDFANGELIVGGDGVNELVVFADAGFGAKRLLSAGGGPCGMAAAGSYVYFGEQQTGQVYRVPFAGGSKELLANGNDVRTPVGMAATDAAVYWRNYDGGVIMRLAR